MTGLWSLESSAQLFTQNLLTQHAQPNRAHRGNKAGSGAGNMPAPWLQCVSVWMQAVHDCIRLFVWDGHIELTKPDFLFVQSLILLCVCAVSLLYLFWCSNICYESPWQCVYFIFFNCELTTDTVQHAKTTKVQAHEKQPLTCTVGRHSLLRHIKLLQCSHDMIINLFLCRLLSVSHYRFI